jgi:hypothetical protein
LPDIDYPFHDKTILVTRCGRICLGNKKINFSQVFAGQAVGINNSWQSSNSKCGKRRNDFLLGSNTQNDGFKSLPRETDLQFPERDP